MENRSTSSNDQAGSIYLTIDDHTAVIFTWVVLTFLCQVIDVFGVVTNVINIVCFVKQGFKEPVNITLLALAVSDLGCLITLIYTNISVTPAFVAADLPFEAMGVFYLVAGIPHITFTRVTSWITAIITLERCLCIVAPLKVKSIITPKRVTILVVFVFAVLMSTVAPIYVVNKLDMVFMAHKNRTLLALVSSSDREPVEKITFAINNFILPFIAFIVISTCTAILVVNLKKRTQWRASSTIQDDVSVRHQKVARMVVMISALFISCFIPATIVMFIISFEHSFAVGGKNINVSMVIGGFAVVLESINSSSNIFIYYRMSTKYRETFRSIFCRERFGEEPKINV